MTIEDVYPIGSIYETSDSEFNPNEYSIFSGTTWVEDTDACVLISSPNGSAANNIGSLVGADSVKLTTAQMPSHYHTINAKTLTEATGTTANQGNTKRNNGGTGIYNYSNTNGNKQWGTTTTTWRSTGGGQAHNNMQPYIGVKRWRRTA